ncbi:hypothetical protein V9T40_011189 [Parthenolecanium corni]|uniref:Uncharacterized protein n=1 Tax=Parthenolecanium corni TaxID=536013 RepID=A0AAN9T514_9HEMI
MGGVPKFCGHDPPIVALLVLGMIAGGARFVKASIPGDDEGTPSYRLFSSDSRLVKLRPATRAMIFDY